jgi:hypothetical protein
MTGLLSSVGSLGSWIGGLSLGAGLLALILVFILASKVIWKVIGYVVAAALVVGGLWYFGLLGWV